MATYLPPGWPTGVQPPGSEGFERTAVAWLLDVVPPDYRLYGVLRRHPVALATMARHHVAACVEAARQGYRTARTELGGQLPPPGVDAVLAAYRNEGSRLVAAARAVDLVARALRGETFKPRLGPAGQRPASRQEPAGPPVPRPRTPEPAPARRPAGTSAPGPQPVRPEPAPAERAPAERAAARPEPGSQPAEPAPGVSPAARPQPQERQPKPAPARKRAKAAAPREQAAQPPASRLRLVQPPPGPGGGRDEPAAPPRAKPKRAASGRRAKQG